MVSVKNFNEILQGAEEFMKILGACVRTAT